MEDSHYFLKTLGLESYISQDSLPRVDMDGFELDSKIKEEEQVKRNDGVKDDACDKQEAINDEVSQITGNIQADDFFSSLELQSSSKTSTNILSLSFSNKLTGGIVTRSRSFSASLQDTAKASGKIFSQKSETKGCPKKETKRKIIGFKRCIKTKGKSRKLQGAKKSSPEVKEKTSTLLESKKGSNKLDEITVEKNLGLEKNKDDDDWILFNNLTSKKDVDDKMFDRQILTNDLQNPIRRCTPELFSMNSILINDVISDGKDEVDNFLEIGDDSFLEEMDEFGYAPPRSHLGGKWKPGCLTIRTSPMLWQGQNWDNFLDDRNQDEEKRAHAETLIDSPTESCNKFSVFSNNKWKAFAPPASHTGGKWKPTAPPTTHTGGKWKPITPPATHTGGKWKPLEFMHRPKKPDQELMSPVESEHNWKCESERELEPPPTHTGGKWKPNSGHAGDLWKTNTTSKIESDAAPSSHTPGKWGSEPRKKAVTRSTLDVLANCQSTSGKCLKTSGGMIQYYCSPCNRRLSSKKMYKKHIQSELHFKRVLQENELEFDSRSLKLFHGLFTQSGHKERGLGKRTVKKPEVFKNSEMTNFRKEKKMLPLVKIKGKRIGRKEIIRCEVCKVKIPSYQLGKHLVSYYHSRRIELKDPEQQKLILDNIHAIVKQAPYQCGMCKFYCNTHTSFKKHWGLPVHKDMEKSKNQRFWCAFCSFECETTRSMELHLDSNSHREVILAVNKSIPIIIRHKIVFNCSVCFKEFRFNRELIRHQKIYHEIESEKINKVQCSICQHSCKNNKSLQRHILSCHRGVTKIPYFCNACNEFFNTSEEAKVHRNSQFHKYNKLKAQGKNPGKLNLTRSCSFCRKTFEDLSELKAHLLERHFEFLPKCIKCGMVFALSQEVSRHVKNNECDFGEKLAGIPSPELFTCETCPFATNTKSEFLFHATVHQKKSKEEKKISCPLCGSFFTQTALKIHLRTHLKERTYYCSICSKAFVRKDRFVSHLKSKHRNGETFELLEASGASVEKSNELEGPKGNPIRVKEGASFVGENAEKKSEKKTSEKRQMCGDAKCKYVAKDLTDLKNHNLFHVGPKMFQCPECPYSARTNARIKRHYMIHADERSFPCHFCSFKARFKSHLKRHMRLHTGAKPYKCPHCSYTCNILENLRKHVLYTKIHPGKKLYECKLCEFSTNVSKDFKMHLLKNHKDNYSSTEANEVAGIYSKDEDCKNPRNPVAVKPRVSAAQPALKVYPAALKKKVDLLAQKFSPIAPKPSSTTETTPATALNLKTTKNSVEDKRKILKLELEKLKSQITPTAKKVIRSYPSPAEKDQRMRGTTSSEDGNKNSQPAKNLTKGSDDGVLNEASTSDNGLFSVNALPTVISVSEEPPSKAVKSDNSLQQMDLSSGCILYENVLPSEEMELYLLENYQV